MKRFATIAAILFFVLEASRCQSLTLQRLATPSAGGAVATSTLRLDGTAGQGVAGRVLAPGTLHWIGFWFPATSGPSPEFLNAIASAKLLPDGTRVSLAGLTATSGALQPGGFFYVSQSDRASGIRIQPLTQTSAITPGVQVAVTGTMATTDAGERLIAGALLAAGQVGNPLLPLGMAVKLLGGEAFGAPGAGQTGADGGIGLNNVGLLVRCWGKVAGYEGSLLLLDDGSISPVAVTLRNAPSGLMPGAMIEVTGISSLRQSGSTTVPLLIPRSQQDIRLLD